ncbi:U32 family peptidase [Paenibacillus sp. M1]|uniref:U32 family peptidase n=1 Tax=Paenibacillus haidiansis TaxID=1574488 RepID=A0ABU7VQY6_9BACL
MKYYTVAADFKKETIDGYAKLNANYKDSKVLETYGQATIGGILEGGRVLDDIPAISFKELQDYIEYSNSKGIGFNYSLNGSCMGNKEFTEDGVKEIKGFLYKLYDIGVRGLTVALPSLIEIIKSTGLDFEIKASIITKIDNVNKALFYKSMGCERIVTDESLNRSFKDLKNIRQAYGEKVEIIINSLCHKDCAYRMFHYNQTAHDSVDKMTHSINTFYNHRCMLKRAENVGEVFKLCWVRPEDIKLYEEIGITYYKVQGRHTVSGGDPIRALECYFKQSFDGNLIDLLELFNSPYNFKFNLDNKKLDGFIKPFKEVDNFCKRNCYSCGYCERFAQKNLDYDEAVQINKLATEFYENCDEFKNLINVEYVKDENDEDKLVSVEGNKFDFN